MISSEGNNATRKSSKIMKQLYSDKFNIEAQSAEEAVEKCKANDIDGRYAEFECVGETIPSTSGDPGFFKILAFSSSEDYEEWQSRQD